MRKLLAFLLLVLTPVAAQASAYSNAVLALSPVAYYRLDDASGTTFADLSGNNNTLTIHSSGTGLLFQQPSLVPTDTDTSTKGQGNASYASVAHTMPGSLSIAFWFKASASSALADWGNFGIVQNGSYLAYGVNSLAERGDCGGIQTNLQAVTNGNTYFVVLTSPFGGVVKYSVNGSNLQTVSVSTPNYGSGGLYIGYFGQFVGGCTGYAQTPLFNDNIDDVAYFNYQLSQSQINSLYAAGSGVLSQAAAFMGVW